MAVGLSPPWQLDAVAGIRLGTTMAGIRKRDRRDLVLMECSEGTEAVAVFTRNRFCAAPVTVARAHLARTRPRALLINTGFANAGTGSIGESDTQACIAAAAAKIGCLPEEVLPFSTGVIGERLPVERVVAGIDGCLAHLSPDGWVDAAHGIMTTDTVAKGASRQFNLDGRAVTVTGIAKGSGMIRPDMATMLAFIATDARVTREVLQHCLERSVRQTFNRITVDGDTSTNDACVLLATGRAVTPLLDRVDTPDFANFAQAVTEVCTLLAQAIIRDGEGATKFITIDVEGGASESDCAAVAFSIAHSPLVKTAFSASDPNWGRILAAIGRTPLPELDVTKVSIFLDELCVVEAGELASGYTEAKGQAVMQKPEIAIRVELGMGEARTRVWTCDLSHEYVRINADYRT